MTKTWQEMHSDPLVVIWGFVGYGAETRFRADGADDPASAAGKSAHLAACTTHTKYTHVVCI